MFDTTLKLHIHFKHKPTSRDPETQEDQEASIRQSHAARTAEKRSEAQRKNEDIQGHGVGRQDEGTQETPSRRTSVFQHEAVQYLKRKGSEIIAPLTKKARKASNPKPHAVTPNRDGVIEERQSSDVSSDQTLSGSGTRISRAISGIEDTGNHSTHIE